MKYARIQLPSNLSEQKEDPKLSNSPNPSWSPRQIAHMSINICPMHLSTKLLSIDKLEIEPRYA